MTTLEKIRATQFNQLSLADLVLAPLTLRVCYSYDHTREQQIVDHVDYPTVEHTLKQFARVGATVHTIYTISDQLLVYTAHKK